MDAFGSLRKPMETSEEKFYRRKIKYMRLQGKPVIIQYSGQSIKYIGVEY